MLPVATVWVKAKSAMLAMVLSKFDPTTGAELAIPPEVRIYALAGCQHGPGMPLLTNRSILNPEQHAANPLSMLNYTSVMRAALVNIEAWVCEGIEPPPSALPNSSNGTSAEAGDVLRTIAAVAGATAADQALMRTAPAIVSAVDGDGNETAGIRLPEVAVPAATYIGWNVRHPETGGVGQMADMVGSTIPFARTAADRAATGDLTIAGRALRKPGGVRGACGQSRRQPRGRTLAPSR